MKHFYLITNEVKDPQGIFTDRIVAYIEKHGGTAVCVKNERQAFSDDQKGEADCVLVLGGDGTLLRAAGNVTDGGLPLLGINLGTLGYLAEVESACAEEALESLFADEYVREERMMLSGRIYAGEREEEQYALNDVVISRCGSLQIVNVRILVNGRFLHDYCADGVIVATPTGSTGYNLSAGGPIVEPSANLLLLTPICPHTLNTRSIVFSPEDEISVEIPVGKDGTEQVVEANFDGSHRVTMRTGDRLVIRRADKTTGILRLNTESFLTVLQKKMSDV
ncbi:MAG: NAD(+)/NADH kinase [Bacteroidales bacterium]|nr:NAD(+)/NADH kinase [Bacteroidales bacterium]MCM1415496.1 NAD(+)/NADH kinase [bacterium]MCM1423433.1 NAD(+)/NADH kinase [bacterium]